MLANINKDLTILSTLLLVAMSLFLFTLADSLFNKESILIIIVSYTVLLLIKIYSYIALFKKISFTESQYHSNSFIPIFLLPIELPAAIIFNWKILPNFFDKIFKSSIISNLNTVPYLLQALIVFILFSLIFVNRNTFSHKFAQESLLKYYPLLFMEIILSSFFYFGMVAINLSPKLLYVVKEIIIYLILVYYFILYINYTNKTILKTKVTRNRASIQSGKLLKVSGTVIQEIFVKEKFDFFIFKYEKVLKYYKLRTNLRDFLFVRPEIIHLNIDSLANNLQQGDKLNLIGIFYKRSFYEHKELEFIYPTLLQIKKTSVSRDLL